MDLETSEVMPTIKRIHWGLVVICTVVLLSIVALILSTLSALRKTSAIQIWKIDNPIAALTYSPDGRYVAVGQASGTIQLRAVSNGQILHTLSGQPSQTSAIAISSKGDLASGASSGTTGVNLWQVNKAVEQPYAQLGANYSVHALAFSADGEILAVGSNSSEISLWRVADQRLLQTLEGPPSWHPTKVAIQALAFSGDGTMLTACNQDEGVRVWRLPGYQVLTTAFGLTRNTTSNILSAAALSTDARTISTSYSNIGEINIWNLDSKGYNSSVEGLSNDILSLAFSADGKWLASGGGRSRAFSTEKDFAITVLNAEDGRERAIFEGHLDRVRGLTWSPDGKLLASGSDDGTVRLWNVK